MTDRRRNRTTRGFAVAVISAVWVLGVPVRALAAAPVDRVTRPAAAVAAAPARISTGTALGRGAHSRKPARIVTATATAKATAAPGAPVRRDLVVPTTLPPLLDGSQSSLTNVTVPPLPTTLPPLPAPLTVPDLPGVPTTPPASSAPSPSSSPSSAPAHRSRSSSSTRPPGSRADASGRGGDVPVAAPAPASAVPSPAGGALRITPVTIGVGALTGRSLTGGARAAARTMTFPIGIGVLIALFLLLQSRLDRRDPRLATAPVDSDDDTIGFQ